MFGSCYISEYITRHLKGYGEPHQTTEHDISISCFIVYEYSPFGLIFLLKIYEKIMYILLSNYVEFGIIEIVANFV